MPEPQRVTTRLARGVLAALALAAAVLGAVVGVVVGSPVPLAVVGLAFGTAFAVWLDRTATVRVLRSLDTRPLTEADAPRVHNLVEGLSLTSGVPVPELEVVDDTTPDAAVLGRNPRDAVIVFTSGALTAFDRIELEGIVAHLLVRIRDHDIAPTTLAAALGPLSERLGERLSGPDRVTRADLEACQITRYPPGLIAALEKVAAAAPGMTHARAPVPAHLWFAPSGGERASASHPPLHERIALLREL